MASREGKERVIFRGHPVQELFAPFKTTTTNSEQGLYHRLSIRWMGYVQPSDLLKIASPSPRFIELKASQDPLRGSLFMCRVSNFAMGEGGMGKDPVKPTFFAPFPLPLHLCEEGFKFGLTRNSTSRWR